MLAAAEVCHLTRKASRGASAAKSRAAKRMAAALAAVPVSVAGDVERLERSRLPELEVDTVALASRPPGLWAVIRNSAWQVSEREKLRADHWQAPGVEGIITDAEGAAAAMRQHLANEKAYGPVVRRPAIITYVGSLEHEEVLLVGRLSAIDRVIPAKETLDAWRDAGVLGLDDPGSVRVVMSHV